MKRLAYVVLGGLLTSLIAFAGTSSAINRRCANVTFVSPYTPQDQHGQGCGSSRLDIVSDREEHH